MDVFSGKPPTVNVAVNQHDIPDISIGPEFKANKIVVRLARNDAPYDVVFNYQDDTVSIPLVSFEVLSARTEYSDFRRFPLQAFAANYHPKGDLVRLCLNGQNTPVFSVTLSESIKQEIAGEHGVRYAECQNNVTRPTLAHLALVGREFLANGCPGGSIVAESLAIMIMNETIQSLVNPRRSLNVGKPQLLDRELSQIIEYINDNLDKDVSLSALANLVGVSRYYLIRAFKKTMGSTPHAFVISRRIREAVNLLKTSSLSIAEIAYKVGFSSQAHMATTFR